MRALAGLTVVHTRGASPDPEHDLIDENRPCVRKCHAVPDVCARRFFAREHLRYELLRLAHLAAAGHDRDDFPQGRLALLCAQLEDHPLRIEVTQH